MDFLLSFRQILNRVLVDSRTAINVRTDEVKFIIRDEFNSAITYEGRAISQSSNESDPVWQIKRILRIGNIYKTQFADSGNYTQRWDLRNTLFPIPALVNNYSLNFDGINDLCNGGNICNFNHSDAFSVSLWIKPQNVSDQRVLFAKAGPAPAVLGYIVYHGVGGNIQVQLRANTGSATYSTSFTVSADTWSHITITYSGNSNMSGIRVYKNAVVGSTPTASALSGGWLVSQDFTLGSRTGGFYYSGKMDEVTVWDKELSQAEVTELYNSGQPLNPSSHSAFANLVNYWKMGDSDSYPTILDNQGTDHLTMTNMSASAIVLDTP